MNSDHDFEEIMSDIEYNYARLDRESTGSYMTVKFPKPVKDTEYFSALDRAELWVQYVFPGWEVINLSMDNPDEE